MYMLLELYVDVKRQPSVLVTSSLCFIYADIGATSTSDQAAVSEMHIHRTPARLPAWLINYQPVSLILAQHTSRSFRAFSSPFRTPLVMKIHETVVEDNYRPHRLLPRTGTVFGVQRRIMAWPWKFWVGVVQGHWNESSDTVFYSHPIVTVVVSVAVSTQYTNVTDTDRTTASTALA